MGHATTQTAPASAARPGVTTCRRSRSVHVEARRWLPHTDHDVFAYAVRTGQWPAWLGFAAGEDGTLSQPGDRVAGVLRVGRREVEVTWTVRRRLRGIVVLDAVSQGHTVATLAMSFSCWNDGCMAELRLTSAVGTRPRWQRRLRRSLAQLEQLIG